MSREKYELMLYLCKEIRRSTYKYLEQYTARFILVIVVLGIVVYSCRMDRGMNNAAICTIDFMM